MKYNVELCITVDPHASFLESDQDTNLDVLKDLIFNTLYDIDDITINYLEVTND
jgi:hypothetical protein